MNGRFVEAKVEKRAMSIQQLWRSPTGWYGSIAAGGRCRAYGRSAATCGHTIGQKIATPTTGFKYSRHWPTAARRCSRTKAVAQGLAPLMIGIRRRADVRSLTERTGIDDSTLPVGGCS